MPQFPALGMNLVHPGLRMLAAQDCSILGVQLLLTCMAIHQKHGVHARDHIDRGAILLIHLHLVDELSLRVRPAAHVNQTRSAHLIVNLVNVGS